MNVFQRRASERQANRFENVVEEEERPVRADSRNVFERYAEKKKGQANNEFGFIDYVKDIGQQVAAKGVAGRFGAIGDITELAQVPQLKAGQKLPGQQARIDLESQLLDKLNRGEKLSMAELDFLSEQDVLPTTSRLMTTEDIKQGVEATTGIGEGKTAIGRLSGRGAELTGGVKALGGKGKALISGAGAGVAGQSLREVGAPESIALGTEIAGQIATAAFTKALSPSSKQAKEIVAAGRAIGLSENQIAPLIQGEGKVALLSKVARKGEKTKSLFASIKEKLGDSYNTIKASPEAKKALSDASKNKLIKNFEEIYTDLSKTLSPSPDKEAAIKFVEKAISSLDNKPIDPEHLVNFWQDINKSVKWNSIQGGKKALAKLKEPLLDALKEASPKLAKDFEMTNELFTKYSQIAKKLKPDIVDSFVNKGEVLALAPAAIGIIHGNVGILAGLAGEAALRSLSREMLINPYFQNIAKKLVTNFNEASLNGVKTTLKQTREFMERKYPEEDWSFIEKENATQSKP
jgi:hypothetical protein